MLSNGRFLSDEKPALTNKLFSKIVEIGTNYGSVLDTENISISDLYKYRLLAASLEDLNLKNLKR